MQNTKDMMDEALSLQAEPDKVERAKELFQLVIDRADGPTWGVAQLELAAHDYAHGNYARSAERAQAVLDAPPSMSDSSTRARAGVML